MYKYRIHFYIFLLIKIDRGERGKNTDNNKEGKFDFIAIELSDVRLININKYIDINKYKFKNMNFCQIN